MVSVESFNELECRVPWLWRDGWRIDVGNEYSGGRAPRAAGSKVGRCS